MIVCVEGSGNRNPNGAPGFNLIQDPVVASACIAVAGCPHITAAVEKLKVILDPTLYTVGRGGTHIFVSQKSEAPTSDTGELISRRLAMLVDPNDKSVWLTFPALKNWPWP